MNKDKISSQEIIDHVSTKASVSKRAAEEFLKVMIATIEEALLAGEVVKIKNFGTFKLQWNEPRKSVNVQTGEDIIIAGYSKVTFVPDVVLKNVINEPFAHLSAIDLDNNEANLPIPEEEVALDPLRVLNEQAEDIKGLLADINALSRNRKQVQIVGEVVEVKEEGSQREEVPEYDLETIEQKIPVVLKYDEEATFEQPVIPQFNIGQVDPIGTKETSISDESGEPIVSEEPEYQSNYFNSSVSNSPSFDIKNDNYETPNTDEYVPNPFLKETDVKQMRKKRLKLPLIILAILVLLVSVFIFVPPLNVFARNTFSSLTETTGTVKQNFSTTELFNTISKWFAPDVKPREKARIVVVPKKILPKIDSVKVNAVVDSLKLLFDGPRVYKTFIATEKIRSGSRLTLMSQKYYGHPNFWVYIYEANIEKIPNPDNIASGTSIRIPKLDARLIDKSNSKCIQKSLELHDLYVKKRR